MLLLLSSYLFDFSLPFFFQKFKLKNRQFQARYVREKFYSFYSVRARLHGGGGPQVGEVTRLSIYSLILI